MIILTIHLVAELIRNKRKVEIREEEDVKDSGICHPAEFELRDNLSKRVN